MSWLLVLVEGQTEETFFNLVLREHLEARGVSAKCTMICTSREEGRRQHRGGHAGRWEYVEKDIRQLLKSNPDAVTTMLDVYAFPKNMPGFPSPWPPTTIERARALEEATTKAVNDPRFIPGLLVHEFEGLLFSVPEQIAEVAVVEEARRRSIAKKLRAIADAFATPEDIDDHPLRAPSKRIADVVPEYSKPRHGPIIAERVGLSTLRERCPLFSAWLARLEDLSAAVP